MGDLDLSETLLDTRNEKTRLSSEVSSKKSFRSKKSSGGIAEGLLSQFVTGI